MKGRKKVDKPRLYKTLKTFDSDSPDKYSTTFWFYSDNEKHLIAVSKKLQLFGYSTEHCGSSAGYVFLLIVKLEISTKFDDYEQLWNEFDELARENAIVFDGWETEHTFEE
jgi:hypothetical protein